jgi:hypothetical protein
MPRNIDFSFTTTSPDGKPLVPPTEEEIKRQIFENARPMAKRMSEAYANELKIALTRARAIATGSTIRSVRDEMVLESPSRALIQRRVVARRAIVFIVKGRRPGKAPIKFLGTKVSKTGRTSKWFEPVAGLVEWFLALNIRRAAWMPIALAIGRRGIKPRDVQTRAVNQSKSAWQEAIQRFGIDVVNNLFKK